MKTARIASLLCLLFVFVGSVYADTIYTTFEIETGDLSYTKSETKDQGAGKSFVVTNEVYNDTKTKYKFSWYPKTSPEAPVFKSEAPSKMKRQHSFRSLSTPAVADGRISWPAVDRIFGANYFRDGGATGPGASTDPLLESTFGEEDLVWVICRSVRSKTGPPWDITHTIENTYDSPGTITITWGVFKNETLAPGESISRTFTHAYIGLFGDTARLTFAGESYEHQFYANLWAGVK